MSKSNKSIQFPSSTTLWSQDSLESVGSPLQSIDSLASLSSLDSPPCPKENGGISDDSMNGSVSSNESDHYIDSCDEEKRLESPSDSEAKKQRRKRLQNNSSASLYAYTRTNFTGSSVGSSGTGGKTKKSKKALQFRKEQKGIQRRQNRKKKGQTRQIQSLPALPPTVSSSGRSFSSATTTPYDASFPMSDELIDDAISFLMA